MSSRDKIVIATKSLTQWLAHYQPAKVIAVDEDGQEHAIAVSRHKHKWNIVAKAIESVDAVTLRLLGADDSIQATRKLRSVEVVQSETETDATPATPGGYDVMAVVQCVAREVREAVAESTKAMREMVADVVRSQATMLKDMSERHSASEKALLDAREQIMIEREERIAEREEVAANAAAEAERADAHEKNQLFKDVLGMAMQNPAAVKDFLGGGLNGKAAKVAVAVKTVDVPAVKAPPVKPDA